MAAHVTDGRCRLASPATANTLAILSTALWVAAIPLTAANHTLADPRGGAIIPAIISAATVGVVVARRQPRNPVGWALLVCAVLMAASDCSGAYAALVYRFGHAALPLGPLAVLLALLWVPAIVVAPLLLLLFPDGTLRSPWRWVLRAYLVIGTCWLVSIYTVAVATITAHRIQVDIGGYLTVIDKPSGSAAWLTPVQDLILPVLVVFWLSFLSRQVASFRSSFEERRQQLKWLLSGAVAGFSGGAVVTLVPALDTHLSARAQAGITVGVVLTIAFPASIGVGILKYRLYDIDRIISRTLAYGIVTGLLVGTYAGLVLLATQVLAINSPAAVAAATLAAAALFNPVRRRVQHMLDRRFNRTRYDADKIIAAFAARLQDTVDLDAVRAALLSTAYQALEPEHAAVWITQHQS